MPDMRLQASSTSAQARTAHAFALSGVGAPGADRLTRVDELGDLPEDGYLVTSRGFWRQNEEESVREARQTGRGLLVSFWADWCFACLELEEGPLREPAVRAEIFARYVPLRIDVSEETRLGRTQLARYGVDHLPAIIIIDDRGRERARIGEYVSEQVMLERLRSAVDHALR